MKSGRTLLLNLLIGLNAFILFFLLFESRIAVPPVLQVIGRAHPLLLHFPIVLLFLAWSVTLFGGRLGFPHASSVRIVNALLSGSALLAAITVIAGLLLSREGGYEGGAFLWHKWSGVSVSFLATALLWCRRRFLPAGLGVSLAILIVAGHFGASLTHGEDYLFEPLRREQRQALDMDAALVYDDLIHPILAAKCLSCHNTGKAKGGLVLADTASLLAGGDSGPLLVKGDAGESLIIARLLLDLDHKHRMPPKGKPQLTADELALISTWVASGADFSVPLATLPPGDTIRQLAVAIYGAPAGPVYDFPPADAATIRRLNTPYRVVKPLAEASPALAVGFYGKTFYTAHSLKELDPVREQLVSLNLNGMPLVESDRAVLATFANLRALLLNDTPVDDSWIAELGRLPRLTALSLSGTMITEAGVTGLLSASNVRKIYLWNTSIDAGKLAGLQQRFRHVRIEQGFMDDGSAVMRLNTPVITPKYDFFRDRAEVVLSHPISGVDLHYTVDGTPPDSVGSPVYTGPVVLESDRTVRVKAFKAGWLSSNEVTRAFIRSGVRPAEVSLSPRPHPQYRGREATALVDLESGTENHADGKWLGFHGQSVIVTLRYDTGTTVDSIGIRVKQHYGKHIYPPKEVTVWGGADSAGARLLGRFRPEMDPPDQVLSKRLLMAAIKGVDIRYLRVELEPYVVIPDGYPAAGNPAWIFIDELLAR